MWIDITDKHGTQAYRFDCTIFENCVKRHFRDEYERHGWVLIDNKICDPKTKEIIVSFALANGNYDWCLGSMSPVKEGFHVEGVSICTMKDGIMVKRVKEDVVMDCVN